MIELNNGSTASAIGAVALLGFASDRAEALDLNILHVAGIALAVAAALILAMLATRYLIGPVLTTPRL